MQVVANASEWALDRHGNLFGLIGPHLQYEFTGIVLDTKALAYWKHHHRPSSTAAPKAAKVSSEAQALAVARRSEECLRRELELLAQELDSTGMADLARGVKEVLRTTPVVPVVVDHAERPHEAGPWSHGRDRDDARHFVQSDDFTHDVRLYIDGDFANHEQRELYARNIAAVLNAGLGCLPAPVLPLVPLEATKIAHPVPPAALIELVDVLRLGLTSPTRDSSEYDKTIAMRFVHDSLASLAGLKAPPRPAGLTRVSRAQNTEAPQ